MKKVILTRDMIEAGVSYNGSYNSKQIKQLGSRMHKNPGWFENLIGKPVTPAQYEAFLDLKNDHLKKKKRNLRTKRYVYKGQDSCPLSAWAHDGDYRVCVLTDDQCDLDNCKLKEHGRIIVDWRG